MKITEMHTLFRHLSQQMGLQNVRGILPEQIDLVLNMSILDILKQIINTNIGLTNANGLVNNSKIGQINSLKTLYKKESFSKSVDATNNLYTITNYIENGKTITFSSLFYIIDASVNYTHKDTETDEEYKTQYFPVRIIDPQYVDNVINDPILKPTITSPIMFGDKLSCGKKTNINGKNVYDKGLDINDVKIGFINKPISVDINEEIDSDMPEQHHVDIVKHAVEIYLSSIGVGQRVENNNNRNN